MSKLKKLITFCRKKKGCGIYTGNLNVGGENQVIRLVDRQVITPTDPLIIKFLYNDPEIEVFCTNEKEQEEEKYRNDDNQGAYNQGAYNKGKDNQVKDNQVKDNQVKDNQVKDNQGKDNLRQR